MTQIAALVAPTHVVDQSIRPLTFDLERSDEGVFRRHRHALMLAGRAYTDGEFERHGGVLPRLVGRDARLSLFQLREPDLQDLLCRHFPVAALLYDAELLRVGEA